MHSLNNPEMFQIKVMYFNFIYISNLVIILLYDKSFLGKLNSTGTLLKVKMNRTHMN